MNIEPNGIFCGDNVSLLREHVLDESVDMVITSPPYDDLRNYKGYSWSFENIAHELTRVLKPGGVIVWVSADATVAGSETLSSIRQCLFFNDVCGLKVRDTMVWKKSGCSAVGALAVQYAPVWEYMFVFSKGRLKTFNPIKDKLNKHAGTKVHGTVRNKDGSVRPVSGQNTGKTIADFGQRTNVWEITEEKVFNKTHPAVFPIALASDHILSWSNEGDVVLDPFCGSGTSVLAASMLKRKWIGLEISQEYVDVAYRRLISCS